MSALAGRTVVVTRPREQAGPVLAALAARGARGVPLPTVEIRPVADPAPILRAVGSLEAYAWIVFTSVNAVRHFVEHLGHRPGGRLPPGVHVAAVGAATARALAERQIRVDAIPEEFVGVQVADAIGDVRGRRVLLPRADLGRAETVDALAAAGAVVDDLTVYHTVPAAPDAAGLDALRSGVDAVTFSSPSTFANLLALLGPEAGTLITGPVLAAIGPVTSAAVRAAGFRVHVEPAEHTMPALLDALETYFAGHAAGVAGDT